MQISEITGFLENAYGVLNDHYFGGALPKVIITVQSSPKAYGHYTPWESWREQETGYREINVGAESLDRPIENVIATLIHEMTHFHNDLQGVKDVSRGGTYHNKRFNPDLINLKENGEYLSTDSAKVLFRIARDDCKIHFKYHNLRHTHASWLAEHSVPAIVVKKTPAPTARTLRWNDPSRPYAREDDVFVDKNGKEWKLTVDAKTGVVGYGLPIATDLGRKENSETVTDGGYVTTLSRKENSGNQYQINPYTGEGHWVSEWSAISASYYPTYEGTKDGELSKDKNFVWSDIIGGWNLVAH